MKTCMRKASEWRPARWLKKKGSHVSTEWEREVKRFPLGAECESISFNLTGQVVSLALPDTIQQSTHAQVRTIICL